MELTLKRARLLAEKTQRDAAECLGVHVQTYRKLEENPELVNVQQAKSLSDFLNVPVDQIFFGANSN